MGKFLFEGASARLSLPLTGDENGAPAGEEVRFARDSPLEEGGFELVVPL